MTFATTLRYVCLNDPPTVWSRRYYIMHDYEIMARQYGVGLVAIMNENDIESICANCDGLVIPGSATAIDPKYYGGTPMDPPPEIDEYALDAALIKYFTEHNKPIFGVCGGFQELNIYFGGSIKKMSDDVAPAHQDQNHEINIVPNSFVYDVFKSERAEVNSYHSWTLDRLAPCFDVVARTADNIIEAIECKEKKIFATEWHPEQSFHTGDRIENKFFENFIECCKKCANKK
ncbi:MAG: gamma-glutamyl-gamma-aminobutyrate hydrolase family protein [Ruminococcaceae bacterium]|nr:gamma-glutamyl-gamma-aminobutyrate hydrolase family protein [Oscillospiraceae bacterium]